MTEKDIMARARAQSEWMTGIRRRLHRIPEAGFQEMKTQRLIEETLRALNIPYTTERTWVVGLIEGARPGKCVALRADMDALPVQERETCPFRSEHEGYMHACGHDAHMAIQLGAAKILSELRDCFAGSVKLLFQPAEESDGGAQPMVAAGVLDEPHVDRVFGLHVMSRLPVGEVETRIGTLNASTDSVEIEILGKAGHGAYPEASKDAIVCAAQVITALQTLVSREVSPLASAVLSIGKIEGGRASNIICDRVVMQGTLRTANPQLRAQMKRRIEEITGFLCQGFGCTANVCVTDGYAALVNWEDAARDVMRIAGNMLGEEQVRIKPEPSMGGEDFSYFIEQTDGAFYHVGCADPEKEVPAAPLHSRDFHVDERCLAIGAAMQTALVLDSLNKR